MRKYFIAGTIAVAVFAMSAFAASLNVDGGVVQAGTDTDLTCADSADVTYSTQTTGDGSFAVNGITVTFAEGCNGNFAYLAVFAGDASAPGGANQTGFGIKEISGNEVSFTVDPADPNAAVDAIGTVSVLVKNSDDSAGTGFTSGIITG